MSIPTNLEEFDFTHFLPPLPDQEADSGHELEQIVEKLNRSEINKIIIYRGDADGAPIFHNEVRLFKEMVQNLGINWEVEEVSDDEFNPSKWDPKRSILMIPAAKASDLDTHLGRNVLAIADFVENFL